MASERNAGRAKIPFNRPAMVGRELEYIAEAVRGGQLAAGGQFTERCQRWLERELDCRRVFLTQSCTAALELSALLCELGPTDEVIMPSYTFVSTANAFLLRGAKPVFVDVRPDTLNLDENQVEAAITSRTRAIVPVHYAGVPCAMDRLGSIAARHDLRIIEDAAHGIGARYSGRALGTIGDLGALSFHETKNVISGEGGALLIQDPALVARAEIIADKGTNRGSFSRGEVACYTWTDLGSSYRPSELMAAFLYAQFEQIDRIQQRRHELHDGYRAALQDLESKGWLRLPVVPGDCEHNAHLFYVLLPTPEQRDDLIAHLRHAGIHAVFHYIPLHESPMGARLGYRPGDFPVTEDVSRRLVRLPCYFELSADQQQYVVQRVRGWLVERNG